MPRKRKPSKAERDVVKAMKREAKALGLSFELMPTTGHGHRCVRLSFRGDWRKTPISGTPRNLGDAIKMKLSDMRRIARELGAI